VLPIILVRPTLNRKECITAKGRYARVYAAFVSFECPKDDIGDTSLQIVKVGSGGKDLGDAMANVLPAVMKARSLTLPCKQM